MNIYQGDTYYKPGSHATGVQNWSRNYFTTDTFKRCIFHITISIEIEMIALLVSYRFFFVSLINNYKFILSITNK